MEVWVEGEVDSETGYVIDLKILKQIINEHIVNEFDHKNLNLDCKEFESLIPTAENIIAVSWKKLRKALDPKYGIKLKLWETENNIFEYDGD
jgi:6-pyruvoyltetrahydropterin/6-carboxytetrahydropterin synthase